MSRLSGGYCDETVPFSVNLRLRPWTNFWVNEENYCKTVCGQSNVNSGENVRLCRFSIDTASLYLNNVSGDICPCLHGIVSVLGALGASRTQFCFFSMRGEAAGTQDIIVKLTKPNNVSTCVSCQLTTASLSGGWVPGMSKGFHFWQPAPRLNNAPMAGTTLQPSHEPPRTRDKNRHPSH